MDNKGFAGSILQIEAKRFGSGYKPEPVWVVWNDILKNLNFEFVSYFVILVSDLFSLVVDVGWIKRSESTD